MGVPEGKKFELVPGVLRPAGVAGKTVEDPYCHSGMGVQLPRQSSGAGLLMGQSSLPAVPLLALGTHFLGVGTLPPGRWHYYKSWAPGSWDRWACVCP